MWYGTYLHNLDNKDRCVLPAKFREKIKDLKSKYFYLTRGLEKCLFLYHQREWQVVEERLKNLPFGQQQARFFNRLFFSGATEVKIDSQGRFIIPQILKEFAHIRREITIIGVGDRIEIWDSHQWQMFYQNKQQGYEEAAENIFGKNY